MVSIPLFTGFQTCQVISRIYEALTVSSSLQLEAYFERLKERTAFQQAPLELLKGTTGVTGMYFSTGWLKWKNICCLPKKVEECCFWAMWVLFQVQVT